jgi:cyclase
MRRSILVFLTLVSTALYTSGHGDGTHSDETQDVSFKTTKVSGNVYMLQGRGGNIGAISGPDGLLIIDDDYRNMSEKLRDALKALGSETPRYIINTHWHGDHTQGNEFFGKTSTIIAHENVRKRLLDPPVIFGEKTPPYAAYALPFFTYSQSTSLYFNGEEIRLVHYPRGHTDGDTVIYFKNAKVVHLGDDFFVGRFPFVDLDSNGSVDGLIHNVAAIITQTPEDAKLIPGHGPLATLDDLKQFYRMLVETSDIVKDAMKAGKSLDDIKKAGLPEKYKDTGSGFVKTEQWIETVYKSVSKK